MDIYLSDQHILRTEHNPAGGHLLTLMPHAHQPDVGDVLIMSSGTWEVLAVSRQTGGTQVSIQLKKS
ncbi:hypothetical protein MF271_20070 (plasmid) [Deinococcus sp. KNUC1210]|uniref:hypothetical protein n=1 Tax=Deinococcus sp. KNUC1210 TaxID=2917691 RepID=UPI001EF0EEB5|nr:hypothetical protein [Deinococcus sp. KNUC1210]ULH17707.1 hypothetical protein MF271_20070 [Deinococcus sp. KNUC1210]